MLQFVSTLSPAARTYMCFLFPKEILSLFENNFEGVIPTEFGNLQNLGKLADHVSPAVLIWFFLHVSESSLNL